MDYFDLLQTLIRIHRLATVTGDDAILAECTRALPPDWDRPSQPMPAWYDTQIEVQYEKDDNRLTADCGMGR